MPFPVPAEPITQPVHEPPVPQPYIPKPQPQQVPPAPAYQQPLQQYGVQPVQSQPQSFHNLTRDAYSQTQPRKSSVPAVLASISLAASVMLFFAWSAASMTSLSGYDTISASIGAIMALFAICAMFMFMAVVFGVASVVASGTTKSYMPLSVVSLIVAMGPLMSLIFVMMMP